MYVRVKDPTTGAEYTTSEQHAKNAELEIVKSAAADDFGRAVPAKLRTDKAGNPVAPKASTATKEA